jgi:hypothetical protein
MGADVGIRICSDQELFGQILIQTIETRSHEKKWHISHLFCAKYQSWAPDTFSISDTQSSDTSMPVFDTDTPILFKIPGSDNRYSRYFTKKQKTSFS